MLESQTSSSSATSFFSTKNDDSIQSSGFPEKFHKVSILTRKVFFRQDFFEVMITNLCEIIECKNGEVINYLNFQCHLPSDEVPVVKGENVELEMMISESSLVYAVKIATTLVGILRQSSQLKVVKVLTKVKSINSEVNEESGEISLRVIFNDQKQLLTNFLDDGYQALMGENNAERFKSIFECVSQKTAAAEAQLNNLTREIEEMSLELQSKVPATMLRDVSELKPDSSVNKLQFPTVRIPTKNLL